MLRHYMASDLPELLRIEAAVHPSPWTEQTFTICFATGCTSWVVDIKGKPIGFIIISLQSGECHILNLGVAPFHQRQGWGEKLLQKVLLEARAIHIGIAYLEVRRSNHKALALYQKNSFQKIGERKNYYPGTSQMPAEDALVLAKSLVPL